MIFYIIQFASFVVMTAIAFSWRKTALKANYEVRYLLKELAERDPLLLSDRITELEWENVGYKAGLTRAARDLAVAVAERNTWAQKWEEEWQKNHSKK